jgi:membrane-associated phospholipid phosphatase
MDKILLLSVFLLVKFLYLPLNKRKSKYYWKIDFDNKIPLIPVFIIAYVGYFFYIPVTVILLWNTKYIDIFLITYSLSYILAEIFWLFVPNGVKRMPINKKDVFSRFTSFIHLHDDDTNGFPSAHVITSLVCSYFLALVFPQSIVTIWIVSFLICISTVLVKQHYILDILGGILFSIASIYLVGLFVTI